MRWNSAAPTCRWNGATTAAITHSLRTATPAMAATTPRWYGRKPRDVLACPSGRGEWSFRLG